MLRFVQGCDRGFDPRAGCICCAGVCPSSVFFADACPRGARDFANEIVWLGAQPNGLAFTRFATSHNLILKFGKRAGDASWNPVCAEYDEERARKRYSQVDDDGRRYQKGPGRLRLKALIRWHGCRSSPSRRRWTRGRAWWTCRCATARPIRKRRARRMDGRKASSIHRATRARGDRGASVSSGSGVVREITHPTG